LQLPFGPSPDGSCGITLFAGGFDLTKPIIQPVSLFCCKLRHYTLPFAICRSHLAAAEIEIGREEAVGHQLHRSRN
jgi:hypothetical protein